jgi:hypothetical protein
MGGDAGDGGGEWMTSTSSSVYSNAGERMNMRGKRYWHIVLISNTAYNIQRSKAALFSKLRNTVDTTAREVLETTATYTYRAEIQSEL